MRRASERFRKDGIAAVGMRTLMADAGLTHGAFYAHFASRADLVSAALEYALASTAASLRKAVDEAPEDGRLDALVHAYLRLAHREHPELGCAVSAMAPEIAREDVEARSQFEMHNLAVIQLIADVLPPGGTARARQVWAMSVFASMMGTLQLMRIAPDARQAKEIMLAGRTAALVLARQWPLETEASQGGSP